MMQHRCRQSRNNTDKAGMMRDSMWMFQRTPSRSLFCSCIAVCVVLLCWGKEASWGNVNEAGTVQCIKGARKIKENTYPRTCSWWCVFLELPSTVGRDEGPDVSSKKCQASKRSSTRRFLEETCGHLFSNHCHQGDNVNQGC